MLTAQQYYCALPTAVDGFANTFNLSPSSTYQNMNITPAFQRNAHLWLTNNNPTNDSVVVIIVVENTENGVKNNTILPNNSIVSTANHISNNNSMVPINHIHGNDKIIASIPGRFENELQSNFFDWVRDCPSIDAVVKKDMNIPKHDLLPLSSLPSLSSVSSSLSSADVVVSEKNRSSPHIATRNDPVIIQDNGRATTINVGSITANSCSHHNSCDHLKTCTKKKIGKKSKTSEKTSCA